MNVVGWIEIAISTRSILMMVISQLLMSFHIRLFIICSLVSSGILSLELIVIVCVCITEA